jgi:GMP synthase-like glutamine amidotransferase
LRRVAVFNYNSVFAGDIENTLSSHNLSNKENALSVGIYNSREYPSESMAGAADLIIHSGGDGPPVAEDRKGIPKLYICHSHQWKAKKEGGLVVRLDNFVKGVQVINVLEDDEILGGKGRMPIMQYHVFAVVRPPRHARVLATSKTLNSYGEEEETVEALRYPDGSVSIQGHPEEGTAAHIIHNFLNRITEFKEGLRHGAF